MPTARPLLPPCLAAFQQNYGGATAFQSGSNWDWNAPPGGQQDALQDWGSAGLDVLMGSDGAGGLFGNLSSADPIEDFANEVRGPARGWDGSGVARALGWSLQPQPVGRTSRQARSVRSNSGSCPAAARPHRPALRALPLQVGEGSSFRREQLEQGPFRSMAYRAHAAAEEQMSGDAQVGCRQRGGGPGLLSPLRC